MHKLYVQLKGSLETLFQNWEEEILENCPTSYSQISDLEQNRPAQIGLVYSPTQPNHSAQNQKSNSKAYGQVWHWTQGTHTMVWINVTYLSLQILQPQSNKSTIQFSFNNEHIF